LKYYSPLDKTPMSRVTKITVLPALTADLLQASGLLIDNLNCEFMKYPG
jgi:hypothetical protein